jgi:hypothetical protein
MSRSLALIIAAAAVSGALLFTRRTVSIAQAPAPAAVGKYESVVFGSKTRLFAATLLIDTTTGRSWSTRIVNQEAQDWAEVKEPTKGAPQTGTEIGRFRISGDYTSDPIGQERGSTIRVDSVTGEVWFLSLEPGALTWQRIRDTQGAAKSPRQK